ncbi:hypothetical protein QQ008_14435 [Fulvivirgaceae bacterium BMA10]|uniref:Transporter n=1 Tax=Splendidivirga corallicola TaxID=3051826 RepID=A0ABT8KPB9_9BACT|nr:hypothetical protein [Fulvivirgaceae bacterium BMA10]
MKKIITIIIISSLAHYTFAQEEEEKKEKQTTFAVNFIHNSVAGFSPIFLATKELKENLNLTFYSIFWTNPTFGTIGNGGDLLLETGIGLGFKLLDNKLYVNPTLGIAHGKFLSGGDQTLIAEGLVPNIFAIYNNDWFEFETYLAYYAATRKGGPTTKDFLLNWIAPGIKVNQSFSLGGYYEKFALTKITDPEVDPFDVYEWLGGYAKVSFDEGKFIRLAMGTNLSEDGIGDDFYKISVFLPL